MVDYIVEQRLLIGRPRPVVFAFLADPCHAIQLTPPWLQLRALGAPARRQAGAVLDYRLRCLGVPLTMRGFVRECDPPFRFLEVQVRGPFARWEHRHRFVATSETTTLMEDRLVYRFPFGLVGRAAHLVVGRHLMAAAWAYRTRRIAELLGPVSSPDA
ncbi:MAG: SRPBCC family protein [Candidatus Rokuibacteriota bacterium]